MMTRLAARYPGYGWERNQGYATLEHREAIRRARPDAVPSALVPRAPADARRRPARRSTCWRDPAASAETHESLARELRAGHGRRRDARRSDLATLELGARRLTTVGYARDTCSVSARCDHAADGGPTRRPGAHGGTAGGRRRRDARRRRAWRRPAGRILARNVHVGRHELDLVAIDPGPPTALVVVEVRWRAGREFGLPEETVDHRKRVRVRAAAYGLLDRGTLPGRIAAAATSRCASTWSWSSPGIGCGTIGTPCRTRSVAAGCARRRVRPGPRDPCYTPARSGARPRAARRSTPTSPGAEHTRGPFRPGRCRHRAPSAHRPPATRSAEERTDRRSPTVPSVSMRQLLEAGVHFGHQTRRWNPKMRPFIFAERNGIHIIDLAQTVQRLDVALEFVRETVARGDQVLFVGTKKQAQEPVAQEATRASQPYVNKRWLGGMLTNFVTIKKRIGLLEQLEARQATGDFERMTKKEAAKLTEEMVKLQGTLGGMRKMKRLPGRDLHRRPASRADRRHRGEQARDPGRRHRRHERRPRRARLHHPGQRRRDPRHPAALHARRRRGDRGRPRALRPERHRARADRGDGRCPRPRRRSPARPTSSSPPSPAAPRSPSSPTSTTTTTCCPATAPLAPRPPSPRRRPRHHAEEIAAELAREAAEKNDEDGGRRPTGLTRRGRRAGAHHDDTHSPADRDAGRRETGERTGMADITAELVKELRERTGAGFMDCKHALTEAGRRPRQGRPRSCASRAWPPPRRRPAATPARASSRATSTPAAASAC